MVAYMGHIEQRGQWTIAACPTPEWAQRVLGNPDVDVSGVLRDGTEGPVLRDDVWRLAGPLDEASSH